MPAVAITAIPPNIWQDNFLTGSTPFAIYPRLVAAQGAPIHYGFKITPDQLPRSTPPVAPMFHNRTPEQVPANTPMDVDRYQQDVAALATTYRKLRR